MKDKSKPRSLLSLDEALAQHDRRMAEIRAAEIRHWIYLGIAVGLVVLGPFVAKAIRDWIGP